MSFEADEEILQDFLVESGEILELLSEQLVDLEQNPDDRELLNAIFRGFHTVKGGAGFLQLDTLVECCHIAENVFDILRNGKRSVDAELMDVVLRALDCVNSMFEEVRNRQEPTPADRQLLKDLERFAAPATESEQVKPSKSAAKAPEPAEPKSDAPAGDITDDEFEQLLDALDGPVQSDVVTVPADSATAGADAEGSADEITDEEFERLLDQLHGSGKGPGTGVSEAPVAAAKTGSDDITDDEFEQLLDELHGAGKFDVGVGTSTTTATPRPAASEKSVSGNDFERLLDEMQSAGNKPAAAAKPSPAPKAVVRPVVHDDDEDGSEYQPAAAKAESKGKGANPKVDSIATETTVRVDTKRLDDIMNMVGELVLVRNRLKRLGDESANESLQKAVSNLDVVTGDLQSAVMQTRMQPIKKVFGRFPRVVRDLARNLRKEVNLVLIGEETDLDKNLVEALSDPLVHLVRNAVDHGIEMPDVREKKGKPRIGQVILSAQQEGDHILLSIEDDGAGMDPDILRRKAVEKGLYDEDAAERLTETECFNLIFAPGFSTKQEISDISGRGVGMDVVKTKITQLNGTVTIESEAGKGSKLSIKVPLTLAIMPTLMVKLGEQSFAFPLVSVVEIFHLDLTRTNVVDGQECVVVRDKVYPLFYIKRWLTDSCAEDKESGHVVIVTVGTQRVGFIVDQLIGQEEVVIKPLGGMLHGTPGMAGATITGDGRIALILDIPSLLQRYA
jgi:two-component system chemotaxis sensor kinase CheA